MQTAETTQNQNHNDNQPTTVRQTEIETDKIKIPPSRMREPDPAEVDALADSLRQCGTMAQAIVVGEDFTLICGLSRLRAARKLGWKTVPVRVVAADGLLARLLEIDENLMRSNLTALQEAEHLEERRRVLEAMGRDDADSASQAPTVAELAAQVGLPKRRFQEASQVARGIPEKLRREIATTPLANEKTMLLELARMTDPAAQRRAALRLAAGEYSIREAQAIIAKELGDDDTEAADGDPEDGASTADGPAPETVVPTAGNSPAAGGGQRDATTSPDREVSRQLDGLLCRALAALRGHDPKTYAVLAREYRKITGKTPGPAASRKTPGRGRKARSRAGAGDGCPAPGGTPNSRDDGKTGGA